MNFKLLKLTAAVTIALMAGSAAAAAPGLANSITPDGYDNTAGAGIEVNYKFQAGSTDAVVKIYQVGNGDGTNAANKNLVGASNAAPMEFGTQANVTIGQGRSYDVTGSDWNANYNATKGNLVKSATGIVGGTVHINQLSDANMADVSTTSTGTGVVTINQGNTAANDGDKVAGVVAAGGKKFEATVSQTGAGTVEINQGNSDDSVVTLGAIAKVIHAGSGSVLITQNSTSGGTNKSQLGGVYTNTDGKSTGDVQINQSNTGNIYLNGDGVVANTGTVTVGNKVYLNNQGSGDMLIKQVGASDGVTQLYANISGTAKLTVKDQGSTGNKIYINKDGDSGNANSGMSAGEIDIQGGSGTNYNNKITVQKFDSTGKLTINQAGHDNSVLVSQFDSGSATVTQDVNSHHSGLILTSSGLGNGSGFVINQLGSYQTITVDLASSTPTTLDAKSSGVSGSNAIINGFN